MSGNAPVPPPPPPPDRSGDGAGNEAQWQLGGQRRPAWLPQAQASQVPQAQASQQPQGQAYPPRATSRPAPPAVRATLSQQGAGLPPQRAPPQGPPGRVHRRRVQPPSAPARQPARRAGSARAGSTFIIVDVLLVLAVVAVAFSVLRPADSPSDAGASAQAGVESPSADSESSVPPAVVEQFAAPSGNITCEITSESATCGIAVLANKPAPVDGCDGTVG